MRRDQEHKQESYKSTPVEAPKAKADGWPKFLKSMTGFGYSDPDTNIRYSTTPVKVGDAPKAGSWLHGQMTAGYIGEA